MSQRLFETAENGNHGNHPEEASVDIVLDHFAGLAGRSHHRRKPVPFAIAKPGGVAGAVDYREQISVRVVAVAMGVEATAFDPNQTSLGILNKADPFTALQRNDSAVGHHQAIPVGGENLRQLKVEGSLNTSVARGVAGDEIIEFEDGRPIGGAIGQIVEGAANLLEYLLPGTELEIGIAAGPAGTEGPHPAEGEGGRIEIKSETGAVRGGEVEPRAIGVGRKHPIGLSSGRQHVGGDARLEESQAPAVPEHASLLRCQALVGPHQREAGSIDGGGAVGHHPGVGPALHRGVDFHHPIDHRLATRHVTGGQAKAIGSVQEDIRIESGQGAVGESGDSSSQFGEGGGAEGADLQLPEIEVGIGHGSHHIGSRRQDGSGRRQGQRHHRSGEVGKIANPEIGLRDRGDPIDIGHGRFHPIVAGSGRGEDHPSQVVEGLQHAVDPDCDGVDGGHALGQHVDHHRLAGGGGEAGRELDLDTGRHRCAADHEGDRLPVDRSLVILNQELHRVLADLGGDGSPGELAGRTVERRTRGK